MQLSSKIDYNGKQMKRGRRDLIYDLIAGVFVLFFLSIVYHITIKYQSGIKVVMPKYCILNEVVSDTPAKAQVVLYILLSGEISESGLRSLLNHLYSSIKERKGFKYHDSPTNIFIYAFSSMERAMSRTPNWISMLGKGYYDVKPKIDINEREIAQLGVWPEMKFGMSEEIRMEIWRESWQAEDRARRKAEEKYPLDPTQSLRVGQAFQLAKETPLMSELEPADPFADLLKMRRLPAQTTIKVLRIAIRHQTPWYFVEAMNPSKMYLGFGWINSIALSGQGRVDPKQQFEKRADLEDLLNEKYEDDLAKKYGLTREKLEKIIMEGFEKDWPVSKQK